jgi:nicotinamide mononucleotide (NMN) deamidase PncC
VGLVCFGWSSRRGVTQTRVFRFDGNRIEVRMQSVAVAIQGLIDLLR